MDKNLFGAIGSGIQGFVQGATDAMKLYMLYEQAENTKKVNAETLRLKEKELNLNAENQTFNKLIETLKLKSQMDIAEEKAKKEEQIKALTEQFNQAQDYAQKTSVVAKIIALSPEAGDKLADLLKTKEEWKMHTLDTGNTISLYAFKTKEGTGELVVDKITTMPKVTPKSSEDKEGIPDYLKPLVNSFNATRNFYQTLVRAKDDELVSLLGLKENQLGDLNRIKNETLSSLKDSLIGLAKSIYTKIEQKEKNVLNNSIYMAVYNSLSKDLREGLPEPVVSKNLSLSQDNPAMAIPKIDTNIQTDNKNLKTILDKFSKPSNPFKMKNEPLKTSPEDLVNTILGKEKK